MNVFAIMVIEGNRTTSLNQPVTGASLNSCLEAHFLELCSSTWMSVDLGAYYICRNSELLTNPAPQPSAGSESAFQ